MKKPLELERQQGYPGKRGDYIKNAAETSAAIPAIGPPFEDMSDTAKEQWKILSYEWEVLLKETDREFLRMYCETWDEWRIAKAMIQVEGHTVSGSRGTPVVSPWVKIMQDREKKLIQLMDKVGANPTARSRVLAGDSKRGDLNKPKGKGFRNSGFLQ